LYCVLDEVQFLTKSGSHYFKSIYGPYEARPILHELIMAWKWSFPGIIISGTGISMEKIVAVASSAVASALSQVLDSLLHLGTWH